jgi:hypothetical protein
MAATPCNCNGEEKKKKKLDHAPASYVYALLNSLSASAREEEISILCLESLRP